MKNFHHIRCDPDLGESFCAMRRIPCACSGCVEQLSKPWLSNLKKNQQPRYVIEPEKCKYFSILHGYNKWYISKLNLKKEMTNPNEMKIKDYLVLQGMTQAEAEEIEYNTLGAFKIVTVTHMDIILLNGQVMHIPYRKYINFIHLILQL